MYCRKKIITQLSNIREKINKMFNTDYPIDEDGKQKLSLLNSAYSKLSNYLELMDWVLIIGNNMVDLYKKDIDSFSGKYVICLHDTLTKVGYIEYYSGEWFISNIGYEIDEEYRGNNYSYYATCLLFEFLSSNGIESASIAVHVDNVASLKIIEKLKKLKLEYSVSEDQERGFVRYRYQFNKETHLNHSQNNQLVMKYQ